MLCYRDRTYCSSDCTNAACDRFVSEEVTVKAQNFGLPLCLGDLSPRCKEYAPPAKED
jgi:hypothetical protein